MNGVIVINKPMDFTSFDVVAEGQMKECAKRPDVFNLVNKYIHKQDSTILDVCLQILKFKKRQNI